MATIAIPDETYKRLEVRAAAAGIPIEQFVVPLLDQMVPPERDPRQRQRAFADLIALIHSNAVPYPQDHVLSIRAEMPSMTTACGASCDAFGYEHLDTNILLRLARGVLV